MVSVLYADTSALVRAYLRDEQDSDKLAALLFADEHVVLSSELTRLEFASGIVAAERAGRLTDRPAVLARFDADCSSEGPISLVPLTPNATMAAARRLVIGNFPLRSLDAIHLAVALHDTSELTGGEPVTFVTRYERQAEAAKANGLEVL